MGDPEASTEEGFQIAHSLTSSSFKREPSGSPTMPATMTLLYSVDCNKDILLINITEDKNIPILIALDSHNSSVKKAGQVFWTHCMTEDSVSPWPKSYGDIVMAEPRYSDAILFSV